ncbi:hypothetical protein A8F94_07370 [Bacillus sp. FJAT-27225]|uniref:hypothetical protein n=1 Tax=Bacillus sp. FJAT-27225 TaxID=1743144 RepID=UPI00080C34C9|nr:hypothetical protein [Bacillus sp. FJAT-27225]OCA87666.1 hypothetical protein A8F94_07370 [Bacillus sp. FJAT-27225]
MDASIWKIISIAGYSLAGLLFITAVFMFFKLNIPAIIGDLSGRTAAKQIREIREQNAKSGRKMFQPDAFNLERGVLTEKVDSKSRSLLKSLTQKTGSRKLDKKGETVEVSRPVVAVMPTEQTVPDIQPQASAPIYSSDGTVVLFSEGEAPAKERDVTFNWGTTKADGTDHAGDFEAEKAAETTVLAEGQGGSAETTVLEESQGESAETTVLAEARGGSAETTVLGEGQGGSEGTMVLAPETVTHGAETTILAVAQGFVAEELNTKGNTAETSVLFQQVDGTEILSPDTEVLEPEGEKGTEVLMPEAVAAGVASGSGDIPHPFVTGAGLHGNETVVLETAYNSLGSGADNGTIVLQEGTTVLGATTVLEQDGVEPEPIPFKIVKDIVIIHTHEIL